MFGLPQHDEHTGNCMKIENSMNFSISDNRQVFYKPILFCFWASLGHSFTDSVLVWQQHFPGGISHNTAALKTWVKNHLVLGGAQLPLWGSPWPSPEPNIEQIPPKFHCLMTFSSLNETVLFFHPLNGFHRHMQNAKDDPQNRPVEKAWRVRTMLVERGHLYVLSSCLN